jgi:hypothetical protein
MKQTESEQKAIRKLESGKKREECEQEASSRKNC